MAVPRLFFAFRSPFSWLAIERLRRVLPDALESIELIPYWEPDARTDESLRQRGGTFHYIPMSKAKHLYILQDTRRLAAKHGMSMAWPVDVSPWWELPHLGWLKARRLGKATDFYDAVVRARWRHAQNICDPAVIRRAAEEAGLDGDAIVSAVDDDEIRAEGVECLLRAYVDDIFGIPYFRLGPHRFWGLDRLDDFLDVFRPATPSSPRPAPRSATPAIPAELNALVGAYDRDTAGGCG